VVNLSYLSDLSSKYFAITTHSTPTADADRLIKGRVHLYGIGVGPRVLSDTAGLRSASLVQLFETNKEGTAKSNPAVKVFEFPLVVSGQYCAHSAMMFGEDDGYVLFENGLYVDEDSSSNYSLDNMYLILYYSLG
tara:strand:+ start:846 stop:1250 length:405 start_codon:yes stop_codon:yes gene_type:complete